MDVFLNNLISFPVVVYTFLMVIIFTYWLLALLGALDIDMFDADIDIEPDMDVETGFDVDTDMQTEGIGRVTGFMLKWGLSGVPVTVVISILISTSWLITYFVSSILFPYIPFEIAKTVAGFALLILSFLFSIPVTAKIIKPMKGAFVSHTAAEKASFLGSECIVKTGKVTESFGQAEYDDGGAGMLFDIRAKTDDGIKKGDRVILRSYDDKEDSYWAIKITDLEE